MGELLDGGGELRPRGWEDATKLRAAATPKLPALPEKTQNENWRRAGAGRGRLGGRKDPENL